MSVRTNLYGAFEFSLPAGGSYIVTASRRGFAPVQYGQKRWKAAGVPVVVEPAGSKSVTIRLPRFGAIDGTLLDENEVGLPEHDVVAYRATRPPQLAARARTDDRGRYRLSGLEPGKYLVRTVAKQYEDGGYVPTYYRDTARVEDALAVDVSLDQQVEDVNLHPAAGRLAVVGGQLSPPAQTNVTLVSDTGAETTLSDAAGNFQFNPTAPGQYELYAQGPADMRGGMQAAYQPIAVDRDRTDIRLALRPLPQVQFFFRDNRGQPVDSRSISLLARRKDLAGSGKVQIFQLPSDRIQFLPGRWDLAVASAPGYYALSFSSQRGTSGTAGGDGWNEVVLTGGSEMVQVLLSATPGAVHGRVGGPGRTLVAGAPVYLEAFDLASRRRVKDVQVTRTNGAGQYQFTDLAPGSYRVLSSFDVDADGSLDTTGTKILQVEEARDVALDLELVELR